MLFEPTVVAVMDCGERSLPGWRLAGWLLRACPQGPVPLFPWYIHHGAGAGPSLLSQKAIFSALNWTHLLGGLK